MANRRLQLTCKIQIKSNQGPVFPPVAKSKSGSRASWRTDDYQWQPTCKSQIRVQSFMANPWLPMTTNVAHPNQGPEFHDEPSTTNDNQFANPHQGPELHGEQTTTNDNQRAKSKSNQIKVQCFLTNRHTQNTNTINTLPHFGAVCVCHTLYSKGSCQTYIIIS